MTGAVVVAALHQERVVGLQVLFRDLMNVDPFAGFLKKLQALAMCLVRFKRELFNIGQVNFNLGIQPECISVGSGLLRLRFGFDRCINRLGMGRLATALQDAVEGSATRDSHFHFPSRLMRW
jgi:hypothetical protein